MSLMVACRAVRRKAWRMNPTGDQGAPKVGDMQTYDSMLAPVHTASYVRPTERMLTALKG